MRRLTITICLLLSTFLMACGKKKVEPANDTIVTETETINIEETGIEDTREILPPEDYTVYECKEDYPHEHLYESEKMDWNEAFTNGEIKAIHIRENTYDVSGLSKITDIDILCEWLSEQNKTMALQPHLVILDNGEEETKYEDCPTGLSAEEFADIITRSVNRIITLKDESRVEFNIEVFTSMLQNPYGYLFQPVSKDSIYAADVSFNGNLVDRDVECTLEYMDGMIVHPIVKNQFAEYRVCAYAKGSFVFGD